MYCREDKHTKESPMLLLSFATATLGQILEGGMIFCFGISWPFSIHRTWKAKKVEGKSLVFLIVVFVGYLFGMASKFAKAAGGQPLETITLFYGINSMLVAIDLALYLRCRSRTAAASAEILSPPVE
jgi:hypothetical protein